MARTSLYLVRHGEQDLSAGQISDSGLSDVGRDQADRIGRRLRGGPFSQIHQSPLRRAVQTASIISGYLPEVPRHSCDLVRRPHPSSVAGA